MPGVIGMGVTQRPEELVQSSTVKNVGNRIQPMCFIGQILETSTEQFLFRNRRSNAIRKIIKISKFTKRTIEQIQTLQPYLQIDTEYILYPAYYDPQKYKGYDREGSDNRHKRDKCHHKAAQYKEYQE